MYERAGVTDADPDTLTAGAASAKFAELRAGSITASAHTTVVQRMRRRKTDHADATARPAPAHPPALHMYLMRMLDEIDYGLILLDVKGAIWHANHLGRSELGRGQVLHVEEGRLNTRVAAKKAVMQQAIYRASQGVRSLIDLRHPPDDLSAIDHHGTSVAFVPMGHPAEAYPNPLPVLAITCRQVMCEQISLHFFAQSYGLTSTEESVLAALSQGLDVEDIAKQRSLALSTVRTHVKQLRVKTQCRSMRELLNKVSVLPPVVSSIKAF